MVKSRERERRHSLFSLQLLSKPKFSGVEKIKTIGSTYMAATGLNATSGQDAQPVRQPLPVSPPLGFHWWASARVGLISVPIVVGGPVSQDADRSCSHLGTMVEFAVALGSKLDIINKHSFNNFRLRVGEGPPLLGQCGTSFPFSETFISCSPAHP